MNARLLLIGVAVFSAGCAPQKNMVQLKNDILHVVNQPGSTIAIAFKDLQRHDSLLINEHTFFHAASTMKTPVLIELYQQAANGRFSVLDSLPVKNSFKSIVDGSNFSLKATDDSQEELYTKIGQKETIYNLAYAMITKSSNLATNLLIELVGAAHIMHTMRALGAADIQVLRGVEDTKAYEQGLNNTTTAYDLMLLFEKMAEGKLVGKEACDNMIKILFDQQFNEIIPALLPKNVRVAHKTGSISTIQHDSGIIFLPDGRKYVLVLLSKFEPADKDKLVKKLAKISRLIYNYVEKH